MHGHYKKSRTRRRQKVRQAGRKIRSRVRTSGFERLEDRAMLSAVPFGAFQDDTGEYMLGDVLVSVVLMESSGTGADNTEDWTAATIQETKEKVVEGVTWWEDTLTTQFPNTVHSLNFEFDFTYADTPVETDVEPISLPSYEFQDWIRDFFAEAGYNGNSSFSDTIRAFNHSQREAYDTNWAFTIFVVNDANDADGFFAPGGFRRAFSFPGGQFLISPAARPASTFAHETGHMFWARDEYSGGGSYTDHRGYYDTYNVNASDNPAPGFTQADSIMATGFRLDNAYAAHDSSTSSLEMIGWRDTDGDGIFDVLDGPFTLSGAGHHDHTTDTYRFVGDSAVQPTFNLNPSGQQNDITLNKITGVEYRVDGGDWLPAAAFDDHVVDLDLSLPLPGDALQTIEIRTIDAATGLASNIFHGDTSRPASVLQAGLNGLVWNDENQNGQYDSGESTPTGWTVRLVDATGVPLDLIETLDPDAYPDGTTLTNIVPEVTITMPGEYAGFPVIVTSSRGNGVFGSLLGTRWTPTGPDLRMDFLTPVTSVRLDAIGTSYGDRGRLEIYDADDNLLDRYTTAELNPDDVETMSLHYETAEIAYAIARGHTGTGVRLDRLRFGSETSTQTGEFGTFSIPNLPGGTYSVEAVPPAGVLASSEIQTVTLGEGEALNPVDFAIVNTASPWQNPNNRYDVDNDGNVLPLDVLHLVNYLNNNADDYALPASPETPPPFYDVNGDDFMTPLDVLPVINELNNQADNSGFGPSNGQGGSVGGNVPSNPSGGEGEQDGLRNLTAFRDTSRTPRLSANDEARERTDGNEPNDWSSPFASYRVRQQGFAATRRDAHIATGAHRELARSPLSMDDVQTQLDEWLDCIADDVDRVFRAAGHAPIG